MGHTGLVPGISLIDINWQHMGVYFTQTNTDTGTDKVISCQVIASQAMVPG